MANVLLQEGLKKGGDEAKFAKAWLKVGVDRSTAKRNTMTFCYGATKPGFSQQLIDHVIKKGIKFEDGIDQFKACNYMGGINWQAVSQVLVKSVEAMGFLQKLAHFMGRNQLDIQWNTPVGLRVTQDYLKSKSKRIPTWWGGCESNPVLP